AYLRWPVRLVILEGESKQLQMCRVRRKRCSEWATTGRNKRLRLVEKLENTGA
ncbi:unnamed protein product, partial [Urochloa humidicola]